MRLAVEITQAHGVQRVECVDVSRHGIFILTDEPPPARFLLRLIVHLPDGALGANAFVSRRVTEGLPGAGLQFFAMSSHAKRRWDAFVARLSDKQRRGKLTEPEPAVPTATPILPPSPEDEVASFMVKLESVERLKQFFERAAWTRSLYLVTPLVRPIGSPVVVLLIHPITGEEVALTGVVSRVSTDAPLGIEIQLDEITAENRAAFAAYLAGRDPYSQRPGIRGLPAPEPEPAPPPAPPPSSLRPTEPAPGGDVTDTGDITGSISVDLDFSAPDGDSLEDEHRFEWDSVSDDLIIDLDLSELESSTSIPAPAAAREHRSDDRASHPAGPGTSLEARVVSILPRRSTGILKCPACERGDRVVTGPAAGVLGLFAIHRTFRCKKCKLTQPVLRALPAKERDVLRERLGDLSTTEIEGQAMLDVAYRITNLWHPPRCVSCSGPLQSDKTTRLIDRTLPNLRSAPLVLYSVSCAGCGHRPVRLDPPGEGS